jgi:hypothetical protein
LLKNYSIKIIKKKNNLTKIIIYLIQSNNNIKLITNQKLTLINSINLFMISKDLLSLKNLFNKKNCSFKPNKKSNPNYKKNIKIKSSKKNKIQIKEKKAKKYLNYLIFLSINSNKVILILLIHFKKLILKLLNSNFHNSINIIAPVLYSLQTRF